MNFATLPPNKEDAVVIPEGYQQSVVISWREPILPNAPKFDVKARTAAAQRGRFGFNNDFAGLLHVPGQKNRFLLVTNHEYVTPQFMFPGYNAKKPAREQFDIEIAALGQHPGEGDDYSIDKPLSHWPEGGNGTARPSVVAVWKANGQMGV